MSTGAWAYGMEHKERVEREEQKRGRVDNHDLGRSVAAGGIRESFASPGCAAHSTWKSDFRTRLRRLIRVRYSNKNLENK